MIQLHRSRHCLDPVLILGAELGEGYGTVQDADHATDPLDQQQIAGKD
jgi:hypothetical protein